MATLVDFPPHQISDEIREGHRLLKEELLGFVGEVALWIKGINPGKETALVSPYHSREEKTLGDGSEKWHRVVPFRAIRILRGLPL